jgi:hypothetical protein
MTTSYKIWKKTSKNNGRQPQTKIGRQPQKNERRPQQNGRNPKKKLDEDLKQNQT